MGRRSKISTLPPQVLEDLNRLLVENGFANYEPIAEWLCGLGYVVSKSAVHRHGSALEAEFEEAMADVRRTRALARAAREESDGDDGILMSAASGILQDNLLRISLAVKRADLDPVEGAKTMSRVAKAFSDVGRLDIARQKWQEEMNAKTAEVAERSAKIAEKGGLSPEAVAEIRKSILGITS